jgi:hypothetical protein
MKSQSPPLLEASTHTASETITAPSPRDRGVTLRVVVLCLGLAFLLGYAIPVIDYKLFNTFLGATHFPPGAIGALLVLVLIVNPLLRMVSKKLAFSRNEALTVYITCLFSSLIPGHGAENFLIPNLLSSFYFATRENKWLEFLEPYVKPWMTPALTADGKFDRSIVEPWYVGLSGSETIPWGAWLVPLFAWGSLVLASYMMLGCLSVMLRAQWSDREALAFPLLRLPMTLTEDMDRQDKYGTYGHFFRNPLMWSGFGIAVFIQALRGLNLYYPDWPTFPLEINLNALFSNAPWNQIGWVPLNTYPIVVGITYLLTSEVAFSLWFFFWFMKFQMMGAYYLGFVPNALPDAPGAVPNKLFLGFQMIGAYLAYVAIVLWTGREHFRHILRRSMGRAAPTPGEREEALSYPVAFWGFALSFAFMIGWSMMAGVRADIAVALWGAYIVFAIGLTRVAVEGGMLFLLHDSAPLGIITRLLGPFGSSWMNTANGMVPASFMQAGLVVHMRGFIMPSFVQSFKLAHDRKIAAKPLLALICAVILISMVMSFITVVRLGYENGGLTLGHKWFVQDGSRWPMRFIEGINNAATNYPFVSWASVVMGSILTYGMMLARSRFSGFPFHPIGYIMSLTYPGFMFWFSIFLGWLFKVLIMRFGGHDSYRKTVPLFLGLALGDIAMILFWLVIDGWQGRTGHQLMPG